MSGKRKRGSRGRGRVPADVKAIAYRRVETLFDLAERAAITGRLEYSHRYVRLAMKVARRATVPVPGRYHGLYCRSCGSFMLPGKTSVVRIRRGRIIRKCLVCGRIRRVNLD